MASRPLKIAYIGAGNVAWHLAPALAPNVATVASRNAEHAAALAIRAGAAAAGFDSLRNNRHDVIIISVADSAIASVAAAIGRLDYNPLVLHTSGTIDKEALEVMSPRTGVLYPLQTFSKEAVLDLASVPFFTESACEADLDIIDGIGRLISPHIYHADAQKRRTLHIAGVFTSNFVNVLLESVQTVLAPDGYGLDVVRPLLEETTKKAFAIGPHDAQTGPARRGDTAVTKRQFDALPEHLRPVYKALTDLIMYNHGIHQ